jgi:oligopeptide transport system substrate-binding protein
MNLRKILLLTTCLAFSFTNMAFAETHMKNGEKLAENQSYTYRVLDSFKTLDPQLNADTDGSDVLRNLFETLMNEDSQGNLVPGAASSYDVSSDKLTYTFHLRPEAKWSDGTPVTAGDFVYAWQRLADPKTASEYASYLEMMQVENAKDIVAGKKPPQDLGVKALDDHTFQVKLVTPIPYFVKMTVNASMSPVKKSVIDKFGDDWTKPGNLVGNGAYVLAEHVPGEKLVMKRNPNYWNNANTGLDTVTALVINDVNQAMTRYRAGELDKTDIPAGQYPRLKKEYPDQAISTPKSCTYTYLFNVSEKGPAALKDVRVRQALSYAINRDVIVNNILQGGQKPAYNWVHWATAGFKMPDIPAAKMTQKERDEKAVELLKEAGYSPSHPLNLTLSYNTDEGHKKIAIAVAQFWKKVGVNLTLTNMEWKVLTDKMNRQDFEVARYAWCGDYNEASTYLDVFTTSSTNNYVKYSNPAYDKLMQESKTATDPQPLYTKAEEILAKDAPQAPIYQYTSVIMLKPDIHGYAEKNVMNNWYAKDMYRVAK